MQSRNQQRESRRKLSEETFLWKDFLFRALRFLEKKAVCLFVCRREVCIHTCAHTQSFHTGRDPCTSETPSRVQHCAPQTLPPLTEREVLLAAAGSGRAYWVAREGVRAQTPRNLFIQHPLTNLCPNLPKYKNLPWTPPRAAEKSYSHITDSSGIQKWWASCVIPPH